MSSLVSDFIISPVLRQARRFSRSSQPGERIDPVTHHTVGDRSHESVDDSTAEGLEGMDGGSAAQHGPLHTMSGGVLTSSPIEEGGGLDDELEGLQRAATSYSSPTESRRVHSLISDSGIVDNDMSDNPLFGIPGRFRTNSATSSTVNNTVAARVSPPDGHNLQSTPEYPLPASGTHHRTSSLPADDGMSDLRKQILVVQSMEIPAAEKARLMHGLLTRGHSQTKEPFLARQLPRSLLPESMISQERPTTPGSLSSYIWQMNGTSEVDASSEQHTFHLSPDDLKPTYAPLDPPEADEDGDVQPSDATPVLGCRHYKRNVKLQCSTCDQWYTCRLCHDQAEDHILIRKDTKNMLCMICACAQGAGEFCVGCGERTAWYYCDICKLWDNDSNKSIYHCNDCGICRKGRGLGKDFFHCKTCGTCMPMSVEKSHKCIERVSDCDCPICGEYMFTSLSTVVFMPCGHGIHRLCYDEHMKSSYKCPICSKSTVNMESQFRNLDRAIDSQPMPPQFRDTKAMVSCNDCYAKSAVTYHWLGLKCAICDSYNTAQLSILSDPAVEVPALESRETEITIVPPENNNGESSNAPVRPGPIRHRRHSSHILPPPAFLGATNRLSPYQLPQRIGRSVSPIQELGFFDQSIVPTTEVEESVHEDELDFWGRDEPRMASPPDHMEVDMDDGDEDEGSSDGSGMDDLDDEDEDGDEDDRFELFGHR